jgi:hypothetical protein
VRSYDLDALDRRFPDILAALGWKATRSRPDHFAGACPIHAGTDSNFHIDRKADGKWIATCRSQCGGDGWTATRFLAAYLSIPHAEAITKAAELAGVSPTEEPRAYPGHRQADTHAAALRAQEEQEARKREISQAIAARRPALLAPYLSPDWRYDLWESSTIRIPADIDEQAHLAARHLFHPEEILWMGEEKDSGQPHHAAHFRPREEWMKESRLPPRMASGTFRHGSYSRSGESITAAPFIIIESDDLIGRKPVTPAEREENRRQCAALIAFMQGRFRLILRAVIDTAGKSLHAWFDRPSAATCEDLATIAEALAIDPQVITRAHNPLRLPGCIHATTDQPARLLYLHPRSF